MGNSESLISSVVYVWVVVQKEDGVTSTGEENIPLSGGVE